MMLLTSSIIYFYVNVGHLTETSIPRSGNISPLKFLKQRNQQDFLLAHVSHDEVLEIINALENNSSETSKVNS